MINPFSSNKIINLFFKSFTKNRIGFVLNTNDETLNKLFINNLKEKLNGEINELKEYDFFVYGGIDDELYFNTKIFNSKNILDHRKSISNSLFLIQFEDPEIFNDQNNSKIIQNNPNMFLRTYYIRCIYHRERSVVLQTGGEGADFRTASFEYFFMVLRPSWPGLAPSEIRCSYRKKRDNRSPPLKLSLIHI